MRSFIGTGAIIKTDLETRVESFGWVRSNLFYANVEHIGKFSLNVLVQLNIVSLTYKNKHCFKKKQELKVKSLS